MGWLEDVANSLKGVASNAQSSVNQSIPAFSNAGGAITEAYKGSAPENLRNVFFDPSRDAPLAAVQRQGDFSMQLAQGKNPFAGEGETEYNQNMAKRAAIVASIFGGAALAGGAGAGSSAAPVAGESAAAATPAAWAGPSATTATPGTTAAMYETLGTAAPSSATPGTMAAMQSGSAVPGAMGLTSTAAPAAAAGSGTAAGGSWAPYAQAGGTIMSTLFSGLMQMEQQKEQLKREKQMALAKSHLDKAQAENQALDTLIRVWQGARR